MRMESVWRRGGLLGQRFQGCRCVQGGNLLYLLYWGAGAGVLRVQCAEGCEGCRGIWGCNAVKERKRHSNFFFNQGQTWK